MAVDLRIVCRPASKGSKNAWGREMFPKQIAAWERATVEALWLYKSNLRLNGYDVPKLPITGNVKVSARFLHERPRSHFKSNGEIKESAPKYFGNVPDVDKISRCLLDALTKARVIDDDRHVVELHAIKLYCLSGEPPGAYINVDRVD